jgi:hypothetical protein
LYLKVLLLGVRGGEKVRSGPGAFRSQFIRPALLRALEWVFELALCLGMLIWNRKETKY